ncbi:MAG: minor capsid protein [Alphaproteobacteria bacterium]
MNEKEIEDLMRSDAYRYNYHPDHKETQDAVRNAFEEKYPTRWLRNDIYIWRTKSDEKVRSSHAQRDGKTFYWDNPPEGGHPGEAYNCRCVAEGVWEERNSSKEKEAEMWKKEQERQKREKDNLISEIEKAYQELDDITLKIDADNEAINQLNEELSEKKEELIELYARIKEVAIQGGLDGAEGANEKTGDIASLLEIVLNKEGISQANTIVGTAAGAVGVAIAEYNALESQIKSLKKELKTIEKQIKEKSASVEKLNVQKEELIKKIEELEKKLAFGKE